MSDRALRPLALGDVFDEAFDLYKRNFLLFLLITAAYIIPYYILRAMIIGRLGHNPLGFNFNSSSDGSDAMFGALQTTAFSFMVLPATMGVLWNALTFAACRRYLEKPASLAIAYGATLRRLVPVLFLCVILGLAYGAASLLCFIGLLWPLVVLIFSAQSFVQEAKSPLEAVKRSSRLVAGDSGRVIGALLLLFCFGLALKLGFGAIMTYLLGIVFHVLPTGGDPTASLVLAGVPGKRDRILSDLSLGMTELVAIPFAVSVCTVLYFDFRVRKEAFDIELLAEDLGYPPLDPGKTGPGYMPPAMPAGSAGFGPVQQSPRYQAAAPAWTPPPHQPAPGWSPPSQQPAPGWSPPSQQPAPGWSPPSQQPAPGWSPPSQQPAPGWSPPASQPAPADWAYRPSQPAPPNIAPGRAGGDSADPASGGEGGAN